MFGEKTALTYKKSIISGRLMQGKPDMPLVILCHGFLSDKKSMLPFALGLKNGGYPTFRFDFSEHGESTRSDSFVKSHVKELEIVAANMKKRFRTIIIFGYSLGGLTGALYSIKHSPAALILVNPVVDLRNLLRRLSWRKTKEGAVFRDFFGKKHLVNEAILTETVRTDIAKGIRCPTFVIQSKNDTKAPLDETQRFFDSLKVYKELMVLPHAKHELFRISIIKRINKKTLAFLRILSSIT